ncbi:hypothetical protein A4S06_08245 [Erysipelotrichaceae bacterium MTC7]|nr:hypothetical protein A4S06_08245 [Erysipelotrichaceae bacterium MTC7]
MCEGGEYMRPSNRQMELRKDIKRSKWKLEMLKLLRLVFSLTLALYVCLTCIVRIVYVEGSSMYPTLENGEMGLTGILSRYLGHIERFDIVTTYDHEEQKSLTKRIIGLPGETIQYRDDMLYINGEVVDEYFLDERYKSKQTNHGIEKFTSDFGPLVLGEDEYFLCGDNRRVSRDSRMFGAVKRSDIISKGLFVIGK